MVPGIEGCVSIEARAIGTHAVCARWRLGDGRELTLAANFGTQAVTLDPAPAGVLVYTTGEARAHAALAGEAVPLPGCACAAWIA